LQTHIVHHLMIWVIDLVLLENKSVVKYRFSWHIICSNSTSRYLEQTNGWRL